MAIPKLEECRPGVKAVGFKLIVATEEIAEKTAGGVYLPDQARDKHAIVQVKGRIVSQGSVAWDFAKFPEGTKPKVGDAIMFAKLAGFAFDGADGRKFRIIHDEDVSAIIEENEA